MEALLLALATVFVIESVANFENLAVLNGGLKDIEKRGRERGFSPQKAAKQRDSALAALVTLGITARIGVGLSLVNVIEENPESLMPLQVAAGAYLACVGVNMLLGGLGGTFQSVSNALTGRKNQTEPHVTVDRHHLAPKPIRPVTEFAVDLPGVFGLDHKQRVVLGATSIKDFLLSIDSILLILGVATGFGAMAGEFFIAGCALSALMLIYMAKPVMKKLNQWPALLAVGGGILLHTTMEMIGHGLGTESLGESLQTLQTQIFSEHNFQNAGYVAGGVAGYFGIEKLKDGLSGGPHEEGKKPAKGGKLTPPERASAAASS